MTRSLEVSIQEYCGGNSNSSVLAVRRTCAYFSLTPIQLNQDVLLGSYEGTCFMDSDNQAVERMRGVMQCPCEGNLCNTAHSTLGGISIILAMCLGAYIM